MANYNLTSQQIKDSFQQLAQVSGSIEVGVSGYAVLDGTGSRVNTLHVTASQATSAVSASFAPNTGVTSIIAGTNVTVDQSTGDVTISASGGGSVTTGSLLVTASNVDATITYTKGDGSTFQNTINNVASADSASYVNTLNQSVIISGSKLEIEGTNSNEGLYVEGGSVNINAKGTQQYSNMRQYYDTDKWSGNFNGYQLINNSSGSEAFTSLMATSTFTGYDGTNPVFYIQGGGNNGTYQNTILRSSYNKPWVNITKQASFDMPVTASSVISAEAGVVGSLTGSVAGDIISTGTSTFNSITASNASFTSASIGYLKTITGSATIIGDQYVILNADSPTQRFAGLKVYDSGSGLTGSFEWDSVDDNWIQVETGGSSAGMLTGLSGSKGSEAYPTNNYVIKGTGNHTVQDSSIQDSGALITLGNDVNANGSINFSTFVDLKQQSVNILTGSASVLKLRSTDFSVTDLSNNVSANFTNSGISIKKGTQITGSLIVSQSGLSSGDDVFVLGAPRTGGSSLEGVIRSTVDDGMHFYGNKFFNNGANTFSGGITGFESGPVQFGPAGSPVSLELQNGSSITGSNGTVPISGSVEVDGNIKIEGNGTTLQVGDSSSPAGTPNINLKQDYSGSAAKFANITIDDTSGTEALPTLLGRFANATPYGASGAGSFTVLAGGGSGGQFLHWAFVLDQTGDIKALKEVVMQSGAQVTGSLDASGSLDLVGTADVTGLVAGAGGIQVGEASTAPVQFPIMKVNGDSGLGSIYAGFQISDDSSTANSNMAVSTFTGLDGSNPVFEITGPGSNRLLWSSANYPQLNVPAELKAAGGIEVTGKLEVDGPATGGVTSLAIASTSASMDFADGNFFNLTLANGVDTHLDAANVAAGQTITLVVTNNATGAGTLSFSPDFKFAGGTAPTVTAATDAVDILTFVTTDATSVYGTGLLNFS